MSLTAALFGILVLQQPRVHAVAEQPAARGDDGVQDQGQVVEERAAGLLFEDVLFLLLSTGAVPSNSKESSFAFPLSAS